MSWLAKIEIDSEIVRCEKTWDSYCWHEKVWECFPGNRKEKRDFLFRVDQLDGAFRLWVMGRRKPERPNWCPEDDFFLKELSPAFLSHQLYAFDLKANPLKSVVQYNPSTGKPLLKADGKRKRGKRALITDRDELREWLARKGDVRCWDSKSKETFPGGFQIVSECPLEVSPMVESYFRKKDKETGKTHAAYHGGVQFRGTLEVTDRERFIETYYSGIGGGKGFGFGLLLLAPVNL